MVTSFPGIVFRPSPAGRAGLFGGPDVWEVVDTLLTVRESAPDLTDDAVIAETAELIGLLRSQVRVAMAYYGAYRAEIDESISCSRPAGATPPNP
ncbi:hypothetical protein [Actinophytocola sediminis]